jgi:hypothetical protein
MLRANATKQSKANMKATRQFDYLIYCRGEKYSERRVVLR